MARLPRREVAVDLSWRIALKSARARGAHESRKAIFTNDAVSRGILRFGVYELEYLETLRQLVISLSQRPRIFVDVGAMIGNHSAFLAGTFERVIAIEPNPASYMLLTMNIPTNVDAINLAVSDSEVDMTLSVPVGNVGGAALAAKGTIARAPSNTLSGEATFSVHAMTLDDLLTSRGIDPSEVSLIKIDVEGHEARVLSGGRNLLAKGTALLALECWRDADQAKVFALLGDFGYGYLYDLDVDRKWITADSVPGFARMPLRALESVVLGIPATSARIRPVSAESLPRDFAMLLASKSPLVLPGSD